MARSARSSRTRNGGASTRRTRPSTTSVNFFAAPTFDRFLARVRILAAMSALSSATTTLSRSSAVIWAYQMSRNPASAYCEIPLRYPLERSTHRPVRFPRFRQPRFESQHLQARSHSHQIPLERARQGLVEVTEVERELPLRRRPQPEVEDMSVTAQLHGQTARGPRGEVGSHDGGGTTVVGPRRGRHAAVADRHQVARPRGVLGEHGLQGVMTAPAGVPIARILARQSRPSGPSDRPTLLEGQMVRARCHTQKAFPIRSELGSRRSLPSHDILFAIAITS